ncbi:MAG: hypothetical protein RIC16_11660 [Rhodospirillales bacterium]
MPVRTESHRQVWPLAVAGIAFVVAAVAIALNWPQIVGSAQAVQSGLHRDLARAVQDVKTLEGAAFWSLVGLSFLYGVFHAVGPGHGKMIIAAYLSSHPEHLRRAISISVLSAVTQGLTAIAIVAGGFWLLHLTARESNLLADHLETASYVLVAFLGLYLTLAAGRRAFRRWRGRAVAGCGHDHHHDHGSIEVSEDRGGGMLAAVGLIASIGIRPCSGAVLVLLFAAALDILAAGSIAVMAMSIGTALTVTSLAVLVHSARRYANSMAARMPGESAIWQWSGDLVALAGGLVILLLGLSLLHVALGAPSHPLL